MENKDIHKGHRNRLKKQFLSEGFSEYIPEHKLLEMLLFYSIPRKDTNELAHELLNIFGSFHGVFEATPAELVKIKGISEHTATLIKLTFEINKRYIKSRATKPKVYKSDSDIVEYITTKFFGETSEVVYMFCFDNRNCLIGQDIISYGDINTVALSYRKMAEIAFKYKAASVVLAHNHPAGNLRPRAADARATLDIRRTLNALNIELKDHLIISPDGYISLAKDSYYGSIFKIK